MKNMVASKKQLLILGNDESTFDAFSKIFSKVFDVTKPENEKNQFEYIKAHEAEIAAIFFELNSQSTGNFSTLSKMNDHDLMRKFPVFVIATLDLFHMLETAFAKGIMDVIIKPFEKNVVKHRVENIIELFENRKQMELLFNEQSKLIAKQIVALEKNQWAIIETLGNALDSRDIESGDHVSRVKSITHALAVDLAVRHPEYMLNSKKVELISLASTLHDIGKIAIPDYILKKPASAGRLTEEEFAVIKTHPIEGCKILEKIPEFDKSPMYSYCMEICRSHHERWDGRGYPDGLQGEQIPISAQLVAVADVYDALINKRVYKPSFTHEKSCQMILAGECGKFNPDVLESFKNVIDGVYETCYAFLHNIPIPN